MIARVGMLDWGIGGLGVFRELRARRPDVPVLYWSDTGSQPYGKMTAGALARRVRSVLAAMVTDGATHLVIACNAASTVAGQIGDPGAPVANMIEPAIRMVARALQGRTGVLGVVGGARTIRSGRYRRALTTPTRRVIQRIAQPLSGHIEAGRGGTRAFAADLAKIMAPLVGADAILLACTHYPAVAGAFQGHAPRARLLDPAQAVIDAVTSAWDLPTGRGDRFVTTGDAEAMRRSARLAWGLELPRVQKIVKSSSR